jgi:hypothetical protein
LAVITTPYFSVMNINWYAQIYMRRVDNFDAICMQRGRRYAVRCFRAQCIAAAACYLFVAAFRQVLLCTHNHEYWTCCPGYRVNIRRASSKSTPKPNVFVFARHVAGIKSQCL